jgi:hypothetical protein
LSASSGILTLISQDSFMLHLNIAAENIHNHDLLDNHFAIHLNGDSRNWCFDYRKPSARNRSVRTRR